MEAKQKSGSPMAWVLGQTGDHKGQYVLSVILAIIGVAFSVAPYFVVTGIVHGLMGGNRETGFYMTRCIIIAVLWFAVIFLDEATANVDPENENELTRAIQELTKEKTVIMIVHRLKTVRKADQIFVIDQGQIVQQGRHEELAAIDGLYKNFVSDRREAASWKVHS